MAEPDVSSEECRAQAVAWFLSSEKSIAEIANTLSLSESVVREWVWNATPEDISDDARPDSDPAVRVAEASFSETAVTNAAAVEAVLRAEMLAAEAVARAEAMAAEAVARAEAVAAEAKAAAADAQAQLEIVRAELEAARAEIAVRIAAEAAAREELAAVYAEAVEAIARAEAVANEVGPAKADKAEAVTEAAAVESGPHSVSGAFVQAGEVRNDTVGTSQPPSATATAPVVPASSTPRHLDRSEAEAEARAKIAEVMARARPVELWVHATGRTLEAATAEVLDRLGVDEEHAEIEVLANGSRWLPGRVQVRARVRGRTELRLITKPAGPGPVASAGPGPADGRG